jgi:predicted Abi (CAAX) family protease
MLELLAEFFLKPITIEDVGMTLGLLAAYALLVIPLGIFTKFIIYRPIPFTSKNLLSYGLRSFIIPGATEEIVYRILVNYNLNHYGITATTWFINGISLILFIGMHCVVALSTYPRARETFFKPFFLYAAGILGLCCIFGICVTRSAYVPICIHGLIVAIWLCLLDGYYKLGFDVE